MELAAIFIERIEQLRKQKGLSQEGFAEKLNMTRQNYYRILKRPETITIKQMSLFADSLGGDLPFLLFGKIRDPETEKEMAELQANYEMLKLKYENANLNYERTKAIANHFFVGILSNLQLKLNIDLMGSVITEPIKWILEEPVSDIEKLISLFEHAFMEDYGLPEFIKPLELKSMIKEYIQFNGVELHHEKSIYSIRYTKAHSKKIRFD
jgi:transcriptional regulator with XRE-family HTH domain